MNSKGIDVSYHNGVIDWNKVKADGIEYAIIRAGYGKSTMDNKFLENIVGASTAGLKIGVYWFIYAADVNDAIQNAIKCAEVIELYKSVITLKVWADWEYDSDKRNPQTKESRTNITRAFCDKMQELGYDVGIYANPDYITSKFDMPKLIHLPLWLARYSSAKGDYDAFMWQYTSSGSVNGIKGNVDLNILYGAAIQLSPSYYEMPLFTLVDHLNKINVDSSYNNRKKIATKNGIENYTGTAEQNLLMLEKLQSGKLLK